MNCMFEVELHDGLANMEREVQEAFDKQKSVYQSGIESVRKRPFFPEG